MQFLDAFAISLSGYLLSLAVHAPPAQPITPEQVIDKYEQALEDDLFSKPELPSTIEPAATTTTYIKPTKGILTSRYGMRWGRMHKGIDIAAPIGTPIIASANGTVISAGWNNGGYGYLVEIQHQDGTITRYAHNSQILVTVGQSVSQSQAIALMGSTGRSTGSHCHFEIHLAGRGTVNPLSLISPTNTDALSSR